MFFRVFEFHLKFWQMCKLFVNKLFSLNTYFYSSVWIIMAHSNFDAKNLLSICLQNSPQIFAIVQKFALDNFRDQQFCNLLCEWERLVVVLFTGNAIEVEVPPGMVCLCWYVQVDWLTGRNICRRHCMDLVSIETREENEFVKQRMINGLIRFGSRSSS